MQEDEGRVLFHRLVERLEDCLRASEDERSAAQERRQRLSNQTREYRNLGAGENKGQHLAALMKSFQSEVDLLTKRAERSEGALAELASSVRGVHELFASLSKPAACDERVAELEQALERQTHAEQALRQRAESAEARCTEAEARLQAASAEAEQTGESLARAQRELETARSEVDKQTAAAAALTARVAQQSDELRSLDEEIEALQRSEQGRLELQQQLSGRDAALAELKKQHEAAAEERDGLLRRREEEWNGRLQKAKKKLAEAQDSLAKAVRKSKDREEHWRRVYEEEQKTSRKVIPERDQAKVALRRAEEDKERLQQRINQLQAELDGLKANAAKQSEVGSTLDQQLREARSESLVLQKHLETASIARDQTRRDLEQATAMFTAQLEQLREQCDAFERERDDTRRQFVVEFQKSEEREAALRRQCDDAARQLSDVQAALAAQAKDAVDAVARKQLELDQLKADFADERAKLRQLLDDAQAALAKERAALSAASRLVHGLQQEQARLLHDAREAADRSQSLQDTVVRLETQLQQLIVSRKLPSSPTTATATTAASSSVVEHDSPPSPAEELVAPKPMHMDDEFLRPAGCAVPWQSRAAHASARSAPSLARRTASDEQARNQWGTWLGGLLGRSPAAQS